MPDGTILTTLGFASVAVNERTEWTFVEVRDNQGLSSVVETTGGSDVSGQLSDLMSTVAGRVIEDESQLAELARVTPDQARRSLPLATAISALRTALVDLQAQRDGLSLTQALGGRPTAKVQLYANLNRALLGGERTPRAFAVVAGRAARDGFAIVKCAPFDEVHPPSDIDVIIDLARPGLDRVAAVREAVGPDVAVLVDCHSRFEPHTAPAIAEELAKLNVGWFEEPVEPTRHPEALAEIASRVDAPIAGGESGYGADFFDGLVTSGAVSITMPDIKYCGGVAEAVKAAAAVAHSGGRTSLHGPSGPISNLAGAHVTAAMAAAMPLEFGVYEVPWRAELIEPAERIEGGYLWFPGGPGLGARINPKVLRRYGRRWKV